MNESKKLRASKLQNQVNIDHGTGGLGRNGLLIL